MAHPFGRIGVPFVILGDRPGSRLESRPAAIVAQRALDRGTDEGAPTAVARDAVQLGEECVVDLNVHTHVLTLAHSRER